MWHDIFILPLKKILAMKLGVKGQCMSYKEPHFWAGKSNDLPKNTWLPLSLSTES